MTHQIAGDTDASSSVPPKGASTCSSPKARVWIAALGGTDWDLAPAGKRGAVLIPGATAQAAQQEHTMVMLQNFADELRRRVPLVK